MEMVDLVVAVFADHNAAEAAVKKLAASGFDMKNSALSAGDTTPTRRSSASTPPATGSSFGALAAPSGAAFGACSLARYS